MTDFVVNWEHVWVVTLLGFSLVAALLVLLVFIMKLFGFVMKPRAAKPAVEAKKVEKPAAKVATAAAANDATQAAIAMALHLYYADVHDVESYKLTIRPSQTAWNSKIYGINNLVK